MKINRASLKNATKKTYLEYMRLFPVLKKERNKQYGMLIFTFATMTFFGIFAINPTLTTIAELKRTLKDAQFVENQLSTKIKNLSILQNQYTQIAPDLNTVEHAVPTTAEATVFMGQLQTIVTQSGVRLDSVEFGGLTLNAIPPVDKGSFTFKIQIQGTFSQINAFLTTLTSFDRIVVLDVVSIAKQSAGEATITMVAEGAASFKK